MVRYPAGHVPVTHVQPNETSADAYLASLPPGERDIIARLLAAELPGSQGLSFDLLQDTNIMSRFARWWQVCRWGCKLRRAPFMTRRRWQS